MEGFDESIPRQPHPLTPEQRLGVIQRIQKLAKSAEVGGPIVINPDGGTDAIQTAEIMKGQKSLELSHVKPNDIVWYRTKNGTNFLFVEDRDEHGKLKGPLENVRTDGKDDKSYEIVYFNGSTTGPGGMIKPNIIIQNLIVELILPNYDENQKSTKILMSTPVEEMGIIKAQDIPITPTP